MADPEGDPWSDDEILFLRQQFGSRANAELVVLLKRCPRDIEAKAAEFALHKNKAAFVGTRKMPRWSAGEIAHLRDVYPNATNVSIAHELGRSIKSITSKAHLLGLKKSDERLKQMGEANVSHRRSRPRLLTSPTADTDD